MSKKYVYDFSEGSKDMKDLLGGKGANLAEMTNLGIPVPDGFTITTEACIAYGKEGNQFPEGLDAEIEQPSDAAGRSPPARSWATRITRCWSASAPAPSSACPA